MKCVPLGYKIGEILKEKNCKITAAVHQELRLEQEVRRLAKQGLVVI